MRTVFSLVICFVALIACSSEEAENKLLCEQLQKQLDAKKAEGLNSKNWNAFLEVFNKKVPKGCTIKGNGRNLF